MVSLIWVFNNPMRCIGKARFSIPVFGNVFTETQSLKPHYFTWRVVRHEQPEARLPVFSFLSSMRLQLWRRKRAETYAADPAWGTQCWAREVGKPKSGGGEGSWKSHCLRGDLQTGRCTGICQTRPSGGNMLWQRGDRCDGDEPSSQGNRKRHPGTHVHNR